MQNVQTLVMQYLEAFIETDADRRRELLEALPHRPLPHPTPLPIRSLRATPPSSATARSKDRAAPRSRPAT